MKILHTVESYYPSIGGAQEVVRQLSERLVKLGHDVTVATSKHPDRQSKIHNGVKITEFDIAGKAVIGCHGKDINKYKSFLVNSNFDLVVNYAAQQWATDLAFEVIDKIKSVKVFVPCGFSGLYQPEYEAYFKKMPSIMKEYDATVYLSNNYRDINFARKHKIQNIHLIPNGAGADEFTQPVKASSRKGLGIPKNNFLILHVGSHTGLKGHAESIKIFEEAKIRNATLLIIGNDFGLECTKLCKNSAQQARFIFKYRFSRKRLLVKDITRPQTVAAYKEADLFLFPSNIEASPLVLFEAMATKLPFLTSDAGNAKEIIEWSKGGLLLPTQKDETGYSHVDTAKSAKLVERLYHDSAERKSLAESGYKAWKEHFTWEIITKQYEGLYKKVLPK